MITYDCGRCCLVFVPVHVHVHVLDSRSAHLPPRLQRIPSNAATITTHHTPHTTQDAFTLAVDFFRSKNYMVSEQKVAELWAAEDTDPSDQVSCKYMH